MESKLFLAFFCFAICMANIYGQKLTSMDATECFQSYSGYTLIGLARKAVKSRSLEHCLLQCLQAPFEYNFTCLSASHYPTDKSAENCILNMENRVTKPSNFRSAATEVEPNVNYYENLCAPVKIANATNSYVAVANFTDEDDANLQGYMTFVQQLNETQAVASLFVKKVSPKGGFSLRLTDATACSKNLGSLNSPINTAKYTEIGNFISDNMSNLISGPVRTDKNLLGSDSVLGKAVVLVPQNSPAPVACGVIMPLQSMAPHVVSSMMLFFVCMFFTVFQFLVI